MSLQSDYKALQGYRLAWLNARTLPARMKALMDYCGEAMRFVEAHWPDIEEMIRRDSWSNAA